ncbi:hypothetical protein VRB69_13340 [Erwinia aphidicola]|uniref:hypothetical protein n=1 Tax=Erwinia aphidicola TaxID=68334 RepID=UPI0030D23ACA
MVEKESVMDILTLYFKIRGLINTLKQQGDKNHAEYIKQANQFIAGVDKKDAIKSTMEKMSESFTRHQKIGKIIIFEAKTTRESI